MGVTSLKGPEFLVFYVLFCAVVVVALRLLRRVCEEGATAPVDTRDPYRLAVLRGGAGEAVRLALVRLVDAKFLAGDASGFRVAEGAPDAGPHHPLEVALVDRVRAERGLVHLGELHRAPAVAAWTEATIEELKREGLLASGAVKALRLLLGLVGAGLVIAVAVHKLGVAHAAGRHNTGILEMLVVVAPVAVVGLLVIGRRTRRGDRLLADLRTLVSSVPLVPAPCEGDGPTLSPDLVLVAAVMGIGVLPALQFGFARELFPAARGDGSGGGCGSSSCGSGGGDGGGGGCGGGCGGCGGGCGG